MDKKTFPVKFGERVVGVAWLDEDGKTFNFDIDDEELVKVLKGPALKALSVGYEAAVPFLGQ